MSRTSGDDVIDFLLSLAKMTVCILEQGKKALKIIRKYIPKAQ